MIPRTIHQMWLGPRSVPESEWPAMHPTWEYRMWREADIATLEVSRWPVFQWLIGRGKYSCASDFARAEILYRHGGVWTDTDSFPLRPFDGALFMESGFFAALSSAPPRVRTGTIGAEAGHPVIARWIVLQGRLAATREAVHPCYRKTGGGLLTKALQTAAIKGMPGVMVLPARTFYPTDKRGNEAPGDAASYARHEWWNHRRYVA